MNIKFVNCRYCNLSFSTPLFAKNNKRLCKECAKRFKKFGHKKLFMGQNFTREDFMFWFVSQPKVCVECKSKKNITVDRIIPQSQGGKYELNNIQILCYTCNCCIKRNFKSIKEASQNIKERECKQCFKTLPLSDKFWYRKGFIPKYISHSISLFHNKCKKCILIQRQKYYKINQLKISIKRKELRAKKNLL